MTATATATPTATISISPFWPLLCKRFSMKGSPKIQRLEDLLVWQKARTLAIDVYRVTNRGPFSRDHSLKNQVRRATISITSNIAEGFGRYSPREFTSFLSIASGSASEVLSQILLAHGLDYLDDEEADQIAQSCSEISRMIAGLRRKIV